MLSVSIPDIPREGQVLHVKSANPPPLHTEVEIIKGKTAVAIGLVTERTQFTYQIIVVTSAANISEGRAS